ncbi:single-stranded DNA-binding protein WHY1, chloroplastic-like [Nicotiana tabacum]|uniref:Single-stranded DNA-binding protein WHY1, chloroplastic-like n=2 Tax=Nicotiana TaxID=4085 RepID=A0A1S3YN49_TOBAC|nr:PREDICTED: single-stranded DNA-binding protein WHY1, chloroplastic-like [Nicotiana sylvestris]XP_016453689.1 PREDICTED: single-stranded DNA-binding protein WHY1, chloroplastic-like [Nicotiana tabacum]
MLNLSLSPAGFSLNLQNPSKTSSPYPYHQPLSFSSSFNNINPLYSNTKCSKALPRNLSLTCRHSEYFEPQQQQQQQQQQQGASTPKVYVGYSIYKGKAALTVDPRPPEFSPLDSGAFKLSREGFVLLQFAPAAGVRQYDWGRKQVFSLSVTEMGSLISLGAKDSCEFFHDPNKGRSDEGKVRKVLKVEPLPDGSGHFFNLSVQNKLINLDENIYIPVTKAEFAVLISAFNFVVPYLLGWHTAVNSFKPEDASRSNNANPRSGADLEWSR